MAAFDEIDSAPGQNKFQFFFDVFNATMQFFKGQTAGKLLTANGAGAPVWSLPLIQYEIVEIGDWNMDSTEIVQITTSVDLTKIRTISAMILPDTGAFPDAGDEIPIPLNCAHFQAAGDCFAAFATDYTPQGGVDFSTASCGILYLYRKTGGLFDSTNFNATSYNRGYVTIGYVE